MGNGERRRQSFCHPRLYPRDAPGYVPRSRRRRLAVSAYACKKTFPSVILLSRLWSKHAKMRE